MKLSLAWAFLLQHIKTHIEYRVNFLISAGGTAIWQTTSLLAVQVVLDRTQDLGGWSKHEIFLIYGILTLIMAVPRMFAFNLFFLGGTYIRPGNFDRFLVRPLNPLCHLLADRFSPEGVGDFAVGMVIVARAFRLSTPSCCRSTRETTPRGLMSSRRAACGWSTRAGLS